MAAIPLGVSATAFTAALLASWRLHTLRGDTLVVWQGRRERVVASLGQSALDQLRELYGAMSALPDLTDPAIPADSFRHDAESYLRPLQSRQRFDHLFRFVLIACSAITLGAIVATIGSGILFLEKLGVGVAAPASTSALWSLVGGALLVLVGFAVKVISEHRMVDIEVQAGRIAEESD